MCLTYVNWNCSHCVLVHHFLLNKATTTKGAHAEHHTCKLCGHGFYFCALQRCCGLWNQHVVGRLFDRSVLPTASLDCFKFHSRQAWWRYIDSLGLDDMYTDFFFRYNSLVEVFFGLPLLPSNEIHDAFVVDICQIHSRLTLLWSLQTTFLKTTLMWILITHPCYGLDRRMSVKQYVIPSVASVWVIWTLNSMWNILTYTIVWLSMVLCLRQHNIGYTADGFYRSDDPTNSVKALKEGG